MTERAQGKVLTCIFFAPSPDADAIPIWASYCSCFVCRAWVRSECTAFAFAEAASAFLSSARALACAFSVSVIVCSSPLADALSASAVLSS